jgi:hypothetical protein
LVFVLIVAIPAISFTAKEPWVSLDASGRLVYRTLPRGDRIVEFSYAGYIGGGIALPRVPAVRGVAPSGGDDTAAIPGVIDEVYAMPLKHGFRGAVDLAAATFLLGGTLNIHTSGVVLRGSGSLAGGTTLKLTGEPHVAVAIAGKQETQVDGRVVRVVDAYVPSGAQSLTVDDASGIGPGDAIRIKRYTTPNGCISWAWTRWCATARVRPGWAIPLRRYALWPAGKRMC